MALYVVNISVIKANTKFNRWHGTTHTTPARLAQQVAG